MGTGQEDHLAIAEWYPQALCLGQLKEGFLGAARFPTMVMPRDTGHSAAGSHRIPKLVGGSVGNLTSVGVEEWEITQRMVHAGGQMGPRRVRSHSKGPAAYRRNNTVGVGRMRRMANPLPMHPCRDESGICGWRFVHSCLFASAVRWTEWYGIGVLVGRSNSVSHLTTYHKHTHHGICTQMVMMQFDDFCEGGTRQ